MQKQNYKIRNALPSDAERIYALAQPLLINWKNPQKNGFLVNRYTVNQYRARTQSPFFYVVERDKSLLGFLMCIDFHTFGLLKQQGTLGEVEGDKRFVESRIKNGENLVFGDQIGVRERSKRDGVGTAMMQRLFEDVKRMDLGSLYVGILHKPMRNDASITFCKNLGFEDMKKEATNTDGTTWCMYHKRVNN